MKRIFINNSALMILWGKKEVRFSIIILFLWVFFAQYDTKTYYYRCIGDVEESLYGHYKELKNVRSHIEYQNVSNLWFFKPRKVSGYLSFSSSNSEIWFGVGYTPLYDRFYDGNINYNKNEEVKYGTIKTKVIENLHFYKSGNVLSYGLFDNTLGEKNEKTITYTAYCPEDQYRVETNWFLFDVVSRFIDYVWTS